MYGTQYDTIFSRRNDIHDDDALIHVQGEGKEKNKWERMTLDEASARNERDAPFE